MFSSGLGLDSAPAWGLQTEMAPKQEEQVTFQSDRKANDCYFLMEGQTREVGVCTYYGACRYQGLDYLFQVKSSKILLCIQNIFFYHIYIKDGCGEASMWGSSTVSPSTQCTVSVTGSVEVKGVCTIGGHCKTDQVWSFGHNQCTRGNVRIL